ncbi:MAG: DUF6268 family outer membrane beta-barrel protein [candidate division Zixibacteria bacterium]|nr:DUF6268 family outer membrane beta-barrel protein [candidate division Zixibacteria bacterium]MDH3937529.1 DUF6268 family outer membrane beta-barrel protein [candidate division Zixibacteria bacterium]MDH4035423.1 DUF6268 family outer membrane beta-barrel protein [candidate division Zixibacteria bacterium]
MFTRELPAKLTVIMIVCALVSGWLPATLKAQAKPTLTITSDILPYQSFKDEVRSIVGSDTTSLDDPQMRLHKFRATLTYPQVFAEGRTVLIHELSYQVIDFEFNRLTADFTQAHAAGYTLMLQRRLSQKWSLWALATPSMASDLKAGLSEDDFHFQTAAIAIRHFSDRFSLGIGAAYSTQFGNAAPMPLLAFDWNNGKNLQAKAILPVSVEFWYRHSQRLDLGLMTSGDGNNFHGDPEIYGVANPNMRYTMLTLGPAARIKLTPWVQLHLEAGLVGLHRFEFFDSDHEEASYDLKPKQYARVGLKFGG